MKQSVFLVIDNDEDDPVEAIFAVMSSHIEADRTVRGFSHMNLSIVERDVYGSFQEVEEDNDF